jgi:hypothetical protein
LSHRPYQKCARHCASCIEATTLGLDIRFVATNLVTGSSSIAPLEAFAKLEAGDPTALSARMDPEDLREVISAYQKCVAGTVQRFGGFVAKYMATACLCTLATPRRTKTTPSVLCVRGWS